MKKLLTIFNGLITTSFISQTAFATTISDKEKNLNILTTSDFNSNEIEELIATYFSSVEGVKQIKNLNINDIKEKTSMILSWLLIASIIDEKEEIKTILTTKPENINIANLNYDANAISRKLFTNFILKLSNEKILKIFIFVFFFLDKQLGSFIEEKILENSFDIGIVGNIFEITFPESENNETKKFTVTVKKNPWDNNILCNAVVNSAFKHIQNLVREQFDENTVIATFHEDNSLNEDDKKIIKEKMIDLIKLFVSDNYGFENLKTIYDEIQIQEETLTIDFTNIMN